MTDRRLDAQSEDDRIQRAVSAVGTWHRELEVNHEASIALCKIFENKYSCSETSSRSGHPFAMPPTTRPRIRSSRVHRADGPERATLWTSLAVVAVVCFVLVWSIGRHWDNLRAEMAGKRNRKLGMDTEHHPIAPEAQARLEQVLRARVQDVDTRALALSCGIDQAQIDLAALNARCAHHPVEPRVYMLGERHSGSNIAATLAYSNFDLGIEPPASVRKVLGPGVLVDETVRKEFGMNKHKHDLQDDVGSYGGLAVLAVRNPYDWVRALKHQCYFCSSSNKHQDMEKFVSAPWTSGAHIERPYRDVFDLRKAKICQWLRTAATRTNCVAIVRAEELVLPSTQLEFIKKLHAMTDWPYVEGNAENIRTGGTQNVGRGAGERFDAGRYFTDNVLFTNQTDHELIRTVRPRLDVAFESALGYVVP